MGIFIDVHKKLGNFTLNIRFASEAKRIGILGASGCGKSMTLKSIAGSFPRMPVRSGSVNRLFLIPGKRSM